jgi:hypothetical protein
MLLMDLEGPWASIIGPWEGCGIPITDPWGFTYSPQDMLFEGPRRTMGIFYWPMKVAFEGPSRTMGIFYLPVGHILNTYN